MRQREQVATAQRASERHLGLLQHKRQDQRLQQELLEQLLQRELQEQWPPQGLQEQRLQGQQLLQSLQERQLQQERQEQWLRQHPQAFLLSPDPSYQPLSPSAQPASSLVVRGTSSELPDEPHASLYSKANHTPVKAPKRLGNQSRSLPSQHEGGGPLHSQDSPPFYLQAGSAPSPPRAPACDYKHAANAIAMVQAAGPVVLDHNRAFSGRRSPPLEPPPPSPPLPLPASSAPSLPRAPPACDYKHAASTSATVQAAGPAVPNHNRASLGRRSPPLRPPSPPSPPSPPLLPWRPPSPGGSPDQSASSPSAWRPSSHRQQRALGAIPSPVVVVMPALPTPLDDACQAPLVRLPRRAQSPMTRPVSPPKTSPVSAADHQSAVAAACRPVPQSLMTRPVSPPKSSAVSAADRSSAATVAACRPVAHSPMTRPLSAPKITTTSEADRPSAITDRVARRRGAKVAEPIDIEVEVEALLRELAITPAKSSARVRVRTLRRLLNAGHDAWWAMALVLDGPCVWDEQSQAACAKILVHALAAGHASPYAANAVQAAIWVQPVIAALVCLGSRDERGAKRALASCTRAEQACVATLFAAKMGDKVGMARSGRHAG